MTIIKKFEQEEVYTKKYKKITVLIGLSLFVLVVAVIWANNTVIAYGDKFEKLSNLEKSLEMENQILENEIANNSSLKVISSKSAELGFSISQGIQYVR